MSSWYLHILQQNSLFLRGHKEIAEKVAVCKKKWNQILKNVNSSIFHKAIFFKKIDFSVNDPTALLISQRVFVMIFGLSVCCCCSLELHVWFLVSCRAILTRRKQGASRETIKIPSKAQFWRPRSDLHHHHSILSMSDWTWKPKVTRSDHKNRPWEVGPAHSPY